MMTLSWPDPTWPTQRQWSTQPNLWPHLWQELFNYAYLPFKFSCLNLKFICTQKMGRNAYFASSHGIPLQCNKSLALHNYLSLYLADWSKWPAHGGLELDYSLTTVCHTQAPIAHSPTAPGSPFLSLTLPRLLWSPPPSASAVSVLPVWSWNLSRPSNSGPRQRTGMTQCTMTSSKSLAKPRTPFPSRPCGHACCQGSGGSLARHYRCEAGLCHRKIAPDQLNRPGRLR
jgi:hypothetical protein